jgi:hypothetical protein
MGSAQTDFAGPHRRNAPVLNAYQRPGGNGNTSVVDGVGCCELVVHQFVRIDSVCETVLYGSPVRLQSSTSCALPWGELEKLQQKFDAFVAHLAQQVCTMVLNVGSDWGVS